VSHTALNILQSTRPTQWSKNLLVLAALVFSNNLFSMQHVVPALASCAIFCVLSGAVYLFNDVIDIKSDRAHPVKKERPVASKALSARQALSASIILMVIAIFLAWRINANFAVIGIVYLVSMILYSVMFKHIIILDILTIAWGFVLRAVAGAVAISVAVSPWLLICTFFGALFFLLLKRYHEIQLLGKEAKRSRISLSNYHAQTLNIMIAAATAATIVSYALYTISERTHRVTGSYHLVATIPFVVYGLFRYLHLVFKNGEGGNPEILIFTDTHLLMNSILWIVTVVYIISR
jgi:4-hydroxybenzoate polyprenyltransferase